MSRILVASLSDLDIRQLLGADFCAQNELIFSTSAAKARRLMMSDGFSLIIVNTPLEDEYGGELAMHATERTSAGVMLLVKAASYDMAVHKLEPYGVMVLGKPCSVEYARQSVRLVLATSNRMQGMKRKAEQLQSRINEIKVIDRSKCVLMQYLGLTEAAAHKYIEKEAMETRRSRYEVAIEVLKTYEN